MTDSLLRGVTGFGGHLHLKTEEGTPVLEGPGVDRTFFAGPQSLLAPTRAEFITMSRTWSKQSSVLASGVSRKIRIYVSISAWSSSPGPSRKSLLP